MIFKNVAKKIREVRFVFGIRRKHTLSEKYLKRMIKRRMKKNIRCAKADYRSSLHVIKNMIEKRVQDDISFFKYASSDFELTKELIKRGAENAETGN
jgi:hypothetical protein